MNDSILMLANFADAAEATARYAAALGTPLHLRLAMLNLEVYPAMLASELIVASERQTERNEEATMAGRQALTNRLPGHPKVLEATDSMADGVAEAVRQEHPLLLALGLNHEQSLLDHLLVEQVLPVLRATHRPLLLVPRDAPCVGPPRRVVIAVDDEPFTLNAASRALAPLLAAWGCTFTVVQVHPQGGPPQSAGPGRCARQWPGASSHPLGTLQSSRYAPRLRRAASLGRNSGRFARAHCPVAQLFGRAVSSQRHGRRAAPMHRTGAAAARRTLELRPPLPRPGRRPPS